LGVLKVPQTFNVSSLTLILKKSSICRIKKKTTNYRFCSHSKVSVILKPKRLKVVRIVVSGPSADNKEAVALIRAKSVF
jgi:hypothetical protein